MKLKSYLSLLEKEALVREICLLAKKFSEVSDYYAGKLSGEGNHHNLEKYKKVIKKEFFPDRGYGRARLAPARKAVNDFIKISNDIYSIADVMVFYVEMGADFTNAYGDIDEAFYTSMENMFSKAIEYIREHNLKNEFESRLQKIVHAAEPCGYGFYDTLQDTLNSL